jgi:ABC-type multidrug transport system, ATPase and permease components
MTLVAARSIALVSQDSMLFDDTVRENILYGKPHASQAELEAAASGRPCRHLHRPIATGL